MKVGWLRFVFLLNTQINPKHLIIAEVNGTNKHMMMKYRKCFFIIERFLTSEFFLYKTHLASDFITDGKTFDNFA